MRATVSTGDGVQLTTRSTRRYVVFSISDDRIPTIEYRTDNSRSAFREHRRFRTRRCRVVTVDTLNSLIVEDT